MLVLLLQAAALLLVAPTPTPTPTDALSKSAVKKCYAEKKAEILKTIQQRIEAVLPYLPNGRIRWGEVNVGNWPPGGPTFKPSTWTLEAIDILYRNLSRITVTPVDRSALKARYPRGQLSQTKADIYSKVLTLAKKLGCLKGDFIHWPLLQIVTKTCDKFTLTCTTANEWTRKDLYAIETFILDKYASLLLMAEEGKSSQHCALDSVNLSIVEEAEVEEDGQSFNDSIRTDAIGTDSCLTDATCTEQTPSAVNATRRGRKRKASAMLETESVQEVPRCVESTMLQDKQEGQSPLSILGPVSDSSSPLEDSFLSECMIYQNYQNYQDCQNCQKYQDYQNYQDYRDFHNYQDYQICQDWLFTVDLDDDFLEHLFK